MRQYWLKYAPLASLLLLSWEPAFACPIEEVVAQIQTVSGNGTAARIRRKNLVIPARPNDCILYEDIVEAGETVEIIINTTNGRVIHVGEDYDPSWTAPKAKGTTPSHFIETLGKAFKNTFSPARNRSDYANSRGSSKECEDNTNVRMEILPLQRLKEQVQTIGSDLKFVVAGWKPLAGNESVYVVLRNLDGDNILQTRVCRTNYVVLPIGVGKLKPGEKLTLDISSRQATRLRYQLNVTDPSSLPHPLEQIGDDWVLGAWRLVDAGPDLRIDAASRLQAAPSDSLAAERILQAVWTDLPF